MKDWKDNQALLRRMIAGLLLAFAGLAAAIIPLRLTRLVDVGIRCGGVEYATPLRIRASTMEDLRLLLPADVAAEVNRAYDDVDGVYVLHGRGEARRLSEKLAEPVMQYLRLSEQGVNTFRAIRAALENGTMTQEDVIADAEAEVAAMGPLTPRARVEAVASFVRTEYAVSGGNADALRRNVIVSELWRMAALALAALLAGGAALVVLERAGDRSLRAVFPAAIAIGAAIGSLVLSPARGWVVLAEGAALIAALRWCSPRSRRAVSLAACLVAVAALASLAVNDLLTLKCSAGQLISLMSWAMLAAAPGLWLRNGKEARG